MAGDLERIALPEAVSSTTRRHELWRRTCFEVFFGVPGDSAYWEGNFAPTGDWNLYRFAGYRQGMAEEGRLGRPSCQTTRDSRRLTFTASLDLSGICPDSRQLAAGIACVVEETDGRISHWAIEHCGLRPDFHDRRSFLLALPEVSATTGRNIF